MTEGNQMATIPSIKGSLLQMLVWQVEELLESGSLARSELESLLEPRDLAILGSSVVASGWYPIEIHNRLAELLLERRWQGRVEDMRAESLEASEEFISQKAYAVYQQQAARQEERAGEIITALSRLVFNFSRWHFVGSLHEDWRIEVREAAPFSDAVLITIEAFFERVFSNLLGAPVAVSMHRPEPDRVVFHGKRGD
jgi:hypothetical protein